MIAAKPSRHSLATDRFFDSLKEYLIVTTGLSYYRQRDSELAHHLSRHLNKLGITDCWSYLQLLQSGTAGNDELDELIEDLTIGETYFFRHADLFKALEQSILPELIEKNKKLRRLRIWSAGSSIGAEAYTLSILLKRHLAHLVRDWEITIIGTDINRSFLSRAAKAQYEDWTLRGISDEIKEQCFSRQGKVRTLLPQFTEGVSFQYHNLAKHPFPSALNNLFAFDVILCRNVMIYFSPPVIEGIVSNMRRCLTDGGWLLVGHAEHNLELFHEFRTVAFAGATGYQRVDRHSAEPIRSPERSPACAAKCGPPQSTLDLPLKRDGRKPLPSRLKETPWDYYRPSGELARIRSLADCGEIERANAECQQLLKTEKLNPTCHLYHALILRQLDQQSSCERSLRRAIYLDRNYVLAHYYLGLTLQRLGRQAEAALSLRNAGQLLIALDPECVIEDSDGLTAAELDELVRVQLNATES